MACELMGGHKPNMPAALKGSLENTKVAYRRLGRSGLQVSVPSPGAMSYGSSQLVEWVLEEDQALPILKAAYDRGLNTVRVPVLMLACGQTTYSLLRLGLG